MIEKITGWGDTTPPSLRRIADLLSARRNLPEPVQSPVLREIEMVIQERRSFIRDNVDRQRLARELSEDHKARGAPAKTVESAQSLARSDTTLVIAGQQPGLLLGPLYTLVKCLQAVNLAHRLTEQGLGTVLPAFWNASEDHDHSEIDHIVWLDRERQPIRHELDLDGLPANLSVSAIPKERVHLPDLIANLRQSLTGEPYIEFVLEWVSDSYEKAQFSLADWFDHLLWALLPESGLLILRPESCSLRTGARSILRREIQEPSQSSIETNQAGEYLKRLGLSHQIHKSESRASFFLVEKGCRIPLAFEENHFVLSDGRTYNREDVLHQLDKSPERFSTTAVLRPVVQEACLPTIASVLGPSEVLYHLQLAALYHRHGVPRAALVPRASVTFLERRDLKILNKTGLSPRDFEHEVKYLVREVTQKRGVGDTATLRDELKEHIESTYRRFEEIAETIDPTIVPAIGTQSRRLLKMIDQTEALLVRRQADREELLHRQIDWVFRGLFPLGLPQERVLGVVHFLARYGPDLVNQLAHALIHIPPGTHAPLAPS